MQEIKKSFERPETGPFYLIPNIISEFKLSDAEAINKLEWEFSNHETMYRNDKIEVENALGIVITPQGFKNK